jgi:hypothetical protein
LIAAELLRIWPPSSARRAEQIFLQIAPGELRRCFFSLATQIKATQISSQNSLRSFGSLLIFSL